jgi:hypothetical protein
LEEESKEENMEYISTNLVCRPNLYLNEIELRSPSVREIEERCTKIERKVRWLLGR